MRLDELLPEWHFRSHHAIQVRATADRCYEAIRSLDLGRSRLTRLLFAWRGIRGGRTMTFGRFLQSGFVILFEEPPRELVLGLVAKPWALLGGIERIEPSEFETFDEPGYARIAWSFSVRPRPNGNIVATETRINCTDERSRRRFRLYWAAVGPFSGLIRKEALRQIRSTAEAP